MRFASSHDGLTGLMNRTEIVKALGTSGNARNRTPVASKIAFAMAGARPIIGHSPAPTDGNLLLVQGAGYVGGFGLNDRRFVSNGKLAAGLAERRPASEVAHRSRNIRGLP